MFPSVRQILKGTQRPRWAILSFLVDTVFSQVGEPQEGNGFLHKWDVANPPAQLIPLDNGRKI